MSGVTVTVFQDIVSVVSVAEQGPAGPPGPQGPAGVGSFREIDASAALFNGDLVAVNASNGSVTLSLPSLAVTTLGLPIQIGDFWGASETNPIIVEPFGADHLNGLNALMSIEQNGSLTTIIPTSSGWRTVVGA